MDVTLFETLRAANEVRPFKLVFVSAYDGFRRELERIVESLTTQGLLDFLESPPTIREALRMKDARLSTN